MKRINYLVAGMLLSSGICFAQSPLFTDLSVVNPTAVSPNPFVGIGINNPVFMLHTVAPVGTPGAMFDVETFEFGSGTSVPVGNTYSGAFGQANNVVGGSTESFAFGLNNTIKRAHHSFIAGFQNTISNSVGPNSCIVLGGHSSIDMSHESAAIGEDNHIINGHGSIALGGHHHNDGNYTISIGQAQNNNLPQTIMAGFGGVTTFFLGNNRVGIGNINPQELLHVSGTVRSDDLLGGGNVCADINGNLILSGPCGAGGGITNSCTGVLNFVPKGTDLLGNLGCSQIFDDGVSVGIGTVGPFGYVWAGGLTGPILPPGAGTVKLDVNGVTRSLAYIATSDASMKTDIREITEARSTLQRLSGKTYRWNSVALETTGAADVMQYGFIAQEVAEVMPEAVSVDVNGLYGVNYNYFIPLLTEAVKEQQAEIEQKNADINELRSQLNTMRDELTQLRNAINGGQGNGKPVNMGGSYLEQNEPNPFSQSTVIRFSLSKDVKTAAIYLYNHKGKQEAKYAVQQGQTQITVEQGSLEPGMYVYTLITDGKVVDTKRMMISE